MFNDGFVFCVWSCGVVSRVNVSSVSRGVVVCRGMVCGFVGFLLL